MAEKIIVNEPISIFDIFKIGIGPSSSHTLGPWRAAQRFIVRLKDEGVFSQVTNIKILLYGSLAKTGMGHGTDIAILLGLSGQDPVTFNTDDIEREIDLIKSRSQILLNNELGIDFKYQEDLFFLYQDSLPYHPNALTFQAFLSTGNAVTATYYSIGGGFVIEDGVQDVVINNIKLPFPINRAEDLVGYCRNSGLQIFEVVYKNELTWRTPEQITQELSGIISVMKACVYRGCHTRGVLPGNLNVARRAADLNNKLLGDVDYNDFNQWAIAIRNTGNNFSNILDWVTCFALAVNEENASFGRVVTAPTNGAAGVIPAVMLYNMIFCINDQPESMMQFLMTAAEIGSIFKKGATISAAMGGCQAEIGVSSAMAAGALTESLGGSPGQALMAAEIAMEHHLGLTCDPIGGLVQIPCIERNTMGAIKAITAAQLALNSNPALAKVSLDNVVSTMWQTALDMNAKYKETSDGGLAVQIPINLPEC